MKTIFSIAAVAILIAAAGGPCLALRTIGIVTKEEAAKMGLECRAVGSDPEQVWIELEFKPEGTLKNYSHVELEIQDGEKSLLSYAQVKDTKLDNGRVIVRLLTVRSFMRKITLTVVVANATQAGYEVRVKDFVGEK